MNKIEILDRIEPLFFERAFAEVSMDDIASMLEIKKASVYYHFDSKESLFSSLLERSFERYIESLDSALAASGSHPPKLLERLVNLPSESRNLFAVVSQRGYCRVPAMRSRIRLLENTVMERFHTFLAHRYGFEQTRSAALYLLVDAIAKRICLHECHDDQLP
ncbi:MAG TPA: TetR/AcrR family transcriptional regulator [bacterium]|nr:TetR/AcrR family transcriptional regulator [bacterium]